MKRRKEVVYQLTPTSTELVPLQKMSHLKK